MKLRLTLPMLLLYSLSAFAQQIDAPCNLSARISIGICIDFPCIPLFSHVSGGTPPFQYAWYSGQGDKDIYFNFPTQTPVDTCLTLQVTDVNGCIALASVRYVFPGLPYFPQDSLTLANDTLDITAGGGNFDTGANDHPFAQQYTLVQAPLHGTVALNADGTGTYTPDPGWCGPDHFRYTATDTSGCGYGPIATAWLIQAPCAGILPLKTDCNAHCTGEATFYQNGILTPPFTYLWSDGSTEATAKNLCEGLVSVTVSDALGAVQVYNTTIEAHQLQAGITGPPTVCDATTIQLGSQVTSSSGSDYSLLWTGPGIYGNAQFSASPKPYCTSNSATAEYRLLVQTPDGCSDTAVFSIPVFPRVEARTTLFVPKCAGDTLLINSWLFKPGTPPYTYVWSGPNGVQSNWKDLMWPDITANFSGTYGLTVTDANGCTGRSNATINIPDECEYFVSIYKQTLPYCAGSDVTLQYGMGPSYFLPDQVVWTGPNGFISNDIQTTLENVQPNMTGWYFLQVALGQTILQDSVLITVATDALSITNQSLLAPTKCFAPYDGVLTLDMSAAPPYQVKFAGQGSFQNVNTNPIVRTGVAPGYLNVDIRKNGCQVAAMFDIPYPEPPLVTVQDESCAGGDAAITVSSAHSITVGWTLPNGTFLNNQASLTGIAPGEYKVFIKDLATNCQFKDTVPILPYLDFQFAVLDTPSCTSADGALLVMPAGTITAPVSYEWNTGATDNPLTGLATGGYSVTLTDGAGCSRHSNAVLPPDDACIALVSGRVFANLNCTCTADTNTVAMPFAKICATNGNETTCTYASNTGAYSLALTEPGDYTISAETYLPNLQGTCTEHQYTVGNDITRDTAGVDFFFCGVSTSDLEITGYCEPARPGFQQYASVMVRNNGFWPADTSLLTLQLSPYLTNIQTTPPPAFFDAASHVASWTIPKLALYQQFPVEIRGTVAGMLGDTVLLHGEVAPLLPTDGYLSNNIFDCSTIVTGSFDPNDKQVSPAGAGTAGHISRSDSVLTYTIRFQNTGTDTAFTVVVRDTLDASVFDLGSIKPVYSSHPYRLDVEHGHILVFTFAPIILPDSSQSAHGSKGFVIFNIRVKPDLRQETIISNTAAIYFDYNTPIVTNTVRNTLLPATSLPLAPFEVVLAPNPAGDQTVLWLKNAPGAEWLYISLIAADGSVNRLIFNAPFDGESLALPIDTRSLPAGIYVVSLRSNRGFATQKLVVAGR